MTIHAYVSFNGNCREALDFYAHVFEAEPPMLMTYGDTPDNPDFPISEEMKKRVMHARMTMDGTDVMFADAFPGMPFTAGNNVGLSIGSPDLGKIGAYYDRLKEGGQVVLEMQETFWSKGYGKVIDKFGIEWHLNHESGETAGA